ncbi:ATP F0F1 synthase synthase [Xenorhabdus sp. XENO-7]|uniref:ATP F0F1 synthase synthase n=1 Tax=Xenorhabdus aichiensis TaxID=3025874 RepID=A0ABT5LYD7_9GAMM|nr:ATP F0F1 synthase synthase [Xenorhabdus aichiensis]MDC9620444.1 ATP F0F1 synthase synthase [Xenorhabdus aichiensis]
MKHLIAQIKTRKKEKLFKLLSEQSRIFEIDTDNLALVAYDVDHNLDEDTWFKVEQFRQQDYCLDYLKRDFVAAEYNALPKAEFTKIAYLCSVQDGNFFFQKVFPSIYLTKKLIGFGDAAYLEKSETRLCVNRYPDAIYFPQQDILVFRKLATISSIFLGIDQLYKEATNEEVQKFFDEDFIELADGFNLDKVSKPNRARIALAMDTLDSMESADRERMLTYIRDYSDESLGFDEANQKFEIKNDEQLKTLLYGIEERFYTTELGHKKRLANSVRDLN